MTRRVVEAVLITVLGSAAVQAQSLRVATYLTGLDQPVGLVADPSDDHRQFVVEKAGRVRLVIDAVLQPGPVLDLHTQVASAGEQGLLGLAVDPRFATTGRIWINFTRQPDGATVVARFTRAPGPPFRFDPATRLDLRFSAQPEERFIAQPATNHNGGKLLFDTEGFLLVAMGDGGGANDTYRNAQNPQSLLGKLLRIDVAVPDEADAMLEQREDASRGYRVPPANPFVDGVPIAARPEIWAFGLRNPWRVTLDAPALGGTGALLIGDVGQGAREEVDYEPSGRGGRNYGWPLREGTLTNGASPPGVAPAYLPLVDPIHDYPRSDGVSITGGYVYRGRLLGDAFAGRYVFGDLGNRLRSVGLTVADDGTASAADVRDHTAEVGGLAGSLVSIDADAHGELYLVLLSGTILRLTMAGDADGDGIEDAWANRYGLSGLAAAVRGPYGDPDGDGLVNAREYRQGSHPEGGPVALFGEGAQGFFATRFGLMNDRDVDEAVAIRFLPAAGAAIHRDVVIGAERSALVDAASVPGLAGQAFATVVEASRPLAVQRTMMWPASGEPYGSHGERGVPAPRTEWYFAEGATTAFELFLLIGNPSAGPARVRVDYLRQGAPAVSRSYEVAAASRLTIWVNQEPGLDQAELGAVVVSENGVPVTAERAMYTRGGARTFAAGHAAAGEASPATRWVFAEGSTSAYFETFLSLINPNATALPVEAAVRLQDGSTSAAPLRLTRVVPPRSRVTLWLDREISDEGVAIGGQDGVSVDLTAPAGFVAERAMWWPGSSASWHEAHAAAGFSDPPRATWRLPGGALHANPGGDAFVETYVLIANVGTASESVALTVYFTDRAPVAQTVAVPANSRVSVPVTELLAGAGALPAGPADIAVMVAAASPGAQLYAEQATYGSSSAERWARGSASKGVP